jgi:hypothetical protein
MRLVHILLNRGYIKALLFIHHVPKTWILIGIDSVVDKMTYNCTTPLGRLLLGLIPAFSTPPDGNVPSSQLTEHSGIASAACPHVALSGLYQSTVIHSFTHSLTIYMPSY